MNPLLQNMLGKPKGQWLIEIGGPVIKAAYCTREGHLFTVQKVLTEALPANYRETLQHFFLKVSTEVGISAPVWVFIARNMVTLRDLELPSVDPHELSAMVDLQIGKHTPYNREEIVTHWKKGITTRTGFSRVILAIVHRALLTDYFETLQGSGLQVEKVGLVSSGLPFFVPREAGQEVLLLEVNGPYTEFQIILQKPSEAPSLLFSRALPVGETRLGENEADGLDKLIAEIRRSLEIVQNEQILESPPTRLWLTGALRHFPLLEERLSKELSLTCQALPLLDQSFKFSAEAIKVWEPIRDTISFFGLLGAWAVNRQSHFDLMPAELALSKTLEDRSREIIRLGVWLAVFVTALTGLFFEKIYKERRLLEKLEGRYEQTAEKADQIEQMRGVLELVRRRRGTEGSVLNFLEALHQMTPENIYYLNIAFEENQSMSIKGYSKAMASVFDFVTRFDRLGWIKNVETKYATKKMIREQELIEFEITGKLGEKKKISRMAAKALAAGEETSGGEVKP